MHQGSLKQRLDHKVYGQSHKQGSTKIRVIIINPFCDVNNYKLKVVDRLTAVEPLKVISIANTRDWLH